MTKIDQVTFHQNGDITLQSGATQYSYPRTQFEIDQAFNPNLAAMALSIAIAELIDTVADLQNQIDYLKERLHNNG